MSKRTGLIGTKIGNSSFYDEMGKSIPVTILKVDECVVSNVKTLEKHGYSSIQLASINLNKNLKKISKPQQKLFANLDLSPKKIIKELAKEGIKAIVPIEEYELLDNPKKYLSALSLTHSTVSLPAHLNLNETDVLRIGNIVKNNDTI